jgi:diguanylate cyclase (GGDEF)-like protein/PAS domain S-box-containing protein
MDNGQSIGRLRRAGALGAASIVAVLALQVAVLLFLAVTTSHISGSISASGLRRTYVWRILYDAQVHDAAALADDAAKLQRLNLRFDDLSPDERMLLARFITAPVRADAQALYTVFDERTALYESGLYASRQRFRIVALATGLIALAMVVLLYLLLIHPVERQWEALSIELDERRERFAAIFAQSPDAMAIYRPDGTILRGNAAAIEMLHFGKAIVGTHYSVHIVESERASAGYAFERALSGTASEFETQFRTAEGTAIPVLCNVSPIVVRGKIEGLVGVAKDLTELRASELELARGRERFASLFDFHPDAIVVIDRSGRIARANVQMEVLSQYRIEELIGKPLRMLATAQDELERTGLGSELVTDRPMRLDAALRTRNGTSVMVRVDTVPMRVGEQLEGTYVVARDVSKERELEFHERLQRERLRSLAQITSEYAGAVERQIHELLQFAMKSLDLDAGMVTRVRDDMIYVMYSVGIGHPVGHAVPFEATLTRHVFGTTNVLAFNNGEKSEWSADPALQRERWSSAIVTTAFADGLPHGALLFYGTRPRPRPFSDADRDFVRVVGALVGASLQRERREEELEALAYADPLTRLPNRRYVLEHLQGAIARAERSGGRVLVYYLDLDGFKAINDRYGHPAGDEFLVIAASRLRAVMREGDVLARVGGDEFLAVQGVDPDERVDTRLAERLIKAASEPARVAGHQVRVGASIGIVLAPDQARTAADAIERADEAMYRSKHAGKGVATRYSDPGQ